MKYGVNAFIWTAVFNAENLPLLPRIKAGGFDGVEVSMFRPAEFPVEAIRRGLEENGLECTIATVMSPDKSLISEDASARARSIEFLTACVKQAAAVGAKIIAGPLYSPVGYLPGRRRTQREWDWAVAGYRALAPVLNDHDVTIALEPLNRFETYFLNTAEDAVRLCDEISHPRVGILFDTFHANIEEKDVALAYRLVARHLKHVHTCENDRGTPGTGHIDWAGVFEALREIGYDGWLTIESFGFALGEISAAASIWRDIESSPEDIAFEGVKFIRAMTHN